MTEPEYLPTFAGWLVSLGEDVLSLANLLESSEVRSPWRRVSAEALESLLRASDLIPDGLESLGYLEQAFIFRLLARRSIEGGAGGGEGVSRSVADAGGDGPGEVPEVFEAYEAEQGVEESEVFGVPEVSPDWETAEAPEPIAGEPMPTEAPESSGAAEVGFEEAGVAGTPIGGGTVEAAEGPVAGLEPEGAPAPVSSLPDEEAPGRVARLAADAPLVEEFIGEDLPALLDMAFVEVRRGRRAQQLLEDAEARHGVLREARAWVEGYRAPTLSEGAEELVKIRSFFRTRLLRAS